MDVELIPWISKMTKMIIADNYAIRTYLKKEDQQRKETQGKYSCNNPAGCFICNQLVIGIDAE
jgi:hypothetical protein